MPSWSAFLASLVNLLVGAMLTGMVAAWMWLAVQVRQHRPLLGGPVVRDVPWGVRTVVAAVASWFLLNLVVVLAYSAVTHRPRHRPFAFTEQMFLITVVNSAALVVLPLLVRLGSGGTARDLGLDVSTLKPAARVGALAFLIATWPVNLLHVLCTLLVRTHQKHPLEEMLRGGLGWDVAYLALLSGVVLAPAVEEVLFRGIVQTWMTGVFRRAVEAVRRPRVLEGAEDVPPHPKPASDAFWTDWMPIIITSAIFALAHAPQWPAPIPIFVLSLVLGTVYQRTGSLFASFVLHALFNGFSTLLLFYALLHGAGGAAKSVPPPQSTVTPHTDARISCIWIHVQSEGPRNSSAGTFFRVGALVPDWYI